MVISQRWILNFLVRNIWTNNHILSKQFTLFLGQNYIFLKIFSLPATPGSTPYMWCTTGPVTQWLACNCGPWTHRFLYLVFVRKIVENCGKTSKPISKNRDFQTQNFPIGYKGRNSKLMIIDVNFAKKENKLDSSRVGALKNLNVMKNIKPILVISLISLVHETQPHRIQNYPGDPTSHNENNVSVIEKISICSKSK